MVYEKVRAAEPDEGFDVGTAHNLWLQLGLNGGVVAVGLVLIAFVQYALTAGVSPVRDRDAIMAALFVHGLTEDVVREPKATLLLIAAAIASVSAGPAVARSMAGQRLRDHRPEKRGRPLQQHAFTRRSVQRQGGPGQQREAGIHP